MAVQLDELQKQTIYQVLAPRNLEGYQPVVEEVILGIADAALILSLIRSIWEEGRGAGYRDGERDGENFGSSAVLRLLAQRLNNRAKENSSVPPATSEGQTEVTPV